MHAQQLDPSSPRRDETRRARGRSSFILSGGKEGRERGCRWTVEAEPDKLNVTAASGSYRRRTTRRAVEVVDRGKQKWPHRSNGWLFSSTSEYNFSDSRRRFVGNTEKVLGKRSPSALLTVCLVKGGARGALIRALVPIKSMTTRSSSREQQHHQKHQ